MSRGKLHRASRVIDKANGLCAATASETWAAEVEMLAELGLFADARKLAQEIQAAKAAPEEAKKAAAAALAKIERLEKPFSDPEQAKAEMQRLFDEAAALAEKTDDRAALEASIGKYVAAWEAFHPNGQALAGAGLAARALGDFSRAQRFFDRAIVELEKETGAAWGLAQSGHVDAEPHAILWSPTGKRIVVGHKDAISILDTKTLKEVLRLDGAGAIFATMALSPDEKTLAVAKTFEVTLWDTATGALRRKIAIQSDILINGVSAVAFSPDGKALATGWDDKTLRIYDPQTGALIRKIEGYYGGIRSIAYSPDGKLIAAGTMGGTLRLSDAQTGASKRVFPKHSGEIVDLAFSRDGKVLVSVGDDNKVRTWDAQTGAPGKTIEWPVLRGQVAISPDGKELFLAASSDIEVWSTQTGKLSRTLKAGSLTRAIGISPDGKEIMAGSRWGVSILDTQTGTQREMPGEWREVYQSIAFSPDGKAFAQGSTRKTIRLWDLSSGALRKALEGDTGSVEAMAFSPDGSLLATGTFYGEVRLWDVRAGSSSKILAAKGNAVKGLQFSPDGRILAQKNSSESILWDVAAGAPSTLGDSPTLPTGAVAFSPDGKLIATGWGNNGVQLWDVQAAKLLKTLGYHQWSRSAAVTFSPDGKLVASVAGPLDNTALVWDISTGKQLHKIPTWGNDSAVAFSPDGKLLAVSGMNLWDVQTGAKFGTKAVITQSIRFSPDGSVIIGQSSAGLVQLWDVSAQKMHSEFEGGPYTTANALAISPDFKVFGFLGKDRATLLHRVSDGERIATIRAAEGKEAGSVLTDRHVELVGAEACAAAGNVVCRFGAMRFPLAVCLERAWEKGLLGKVLAGEGAYAEPEDEAELPECAGR